MSGILQVLGPVGNAAFTPYSTEYTTPGTQTVSVPAGATSVTIECIGAGAGAYWNNGAIRSGGGGGGYAKATSYSVSGLSAIYLSIPGAAATGTSGGDAFAKANSSGGTTICLAKGGGVGTYSVGGSGGYAVCETGDVKRNGGAGYFGSSNAAAAGGGAANSASDGGNATPYAGGAAGTGTAPAGAGGTAYANGALYGGGGGGSTSGLGTGAQGWIKLTWS